MRPEKLLSVSNFHRFAVRKGQEHGITPPAACI